MGSPSEPIQFLPLYGYGFYPFDYVVWGGLHLFKRAGFNQIEMNYVSIEGAYTGIVIQGTKGWDLDTVVVKNLTMQNITPMKLVYACCCGLEGANAFGIVARHIFSLLLKNTTINNVRGFFGQCGDNLMYTEPGNGGNSVAIYAANICNLTLENIEINKVYGGRGGDYYCNPKERIKEVAGSGGYACGIWLDSLLMNGILDNVTISNVRGGDGGFNNFTNTWSPGGPAYTLKTSFTGSVHIKNSEFHEAIPGPGGDNEHIGVTIYIERAESLIIGGGAADYNYIHPSDYSVYNIS